MKKTVLFLIFVFTISFAYSVQDFNISPLGMNFNGIIVSGSNIIAYSDAGSYLMTTDKGLNWKQYKISETGNIKMLLNYNDTLWGIMEQGIIIKSTDNGLSWSKHQYPLQADDKFKYLALNENYLYIRCEAQIMQLDKEYNLLNTYKDSILFNQYEDMYGREMYNYMAFSEGKLLVSSRNKEMNHDGYILILDENLEYKDGIKLSQYLTDYPPEEESSRLELRDIFSYNGRKVYIINKLPFYTEDNFTKWTYIYDNPDTGKEPTESDVKYNLYTYNITDDNIYFGISDYHESIDFIWDRNWLGKIIRTLGIYQYNPDIDSFKLKGSKFDNSYYTISEKKFGDDGYSTSLLHTGEFIVFEDSVIVWAGTHKSLIQSRNSGKDWEAVSYAYYPKPRFILNDSLFFCVNEYQTEYYRTTNYGDCFIPAYIDTAELRPKFYNMANTILMYINQDGKGFITAPPFHNRIHNGLLNFAFTSDSGKTFKFKGIDEMCAVDYNSNAYSNVINLGDEVIFAINKSDSSKLFRLNYSDYNYNLIKTDYKFNNYFLLGDNFEEFIMFHTDFPLNDTMQTRFVVSETNDSGKTRKELHSIDTLLNIKQTYSPNKDTVFITSVNPNMVLLYDRTRDKLEKIYENTTDTFNVLSLMHVGDEFFILADSLLLENTDRSDLTQWQRREWDFGTPRFYSVLSNGSVAFVYMKDSLRTYNYYKIKMKDSTPNIVVDNQIEEIQHFFAAKPFPSPADDVANVRIYWDGSFDAESADKYVCDVYGTILKDNGHVYVNYQQAYEAELSWECSHVTSGLYFIVIDQNGTLRNIPVLVVK